MESRPDEYTGAAGHEKKTHQTHFTVTDVWKHELGYWEGFLFCTYCDWTGTVEIKDPADDIPEAIAEFKKHKE